MCVTISDFMNVCLFLEKPLYCVKIHNILVVDWPGCRVYHRGTPLVARKEKVAIQWK